MKIITLFICLLACTFLPGQFDELASDYSKVISWEYGQHSSYKMIAQEDWHLILHSKPKAYFIYKEQHCSN